MIQDIKTKIRERWAYVDSITCGADIDEFISDIDSLEEEIRKEVEEKIPEKKSVDELKEVMGSAYKDLSVQVAFKEGHNHALDDILAALKELRGK